MRNEIAAKGKETRVGAWTEYGSDPNTITWYIPKVWNLSSLAFSLINSFIRHFEQGSAPDSSDASGVYSDVDLSSAGAHHRSWKSNEATIIGGGSRFINVSYIRLVFH